MGDQTHASTHSCTGQLFPDNDPKWKGANSDIFLKEAVRLMKEKGYYLGNLDATIIAQKPKLSPHKVVVDLTSACGKCGSLQNCYKYMHLDIPLATCMLTWSGCINH